MEVCEVQGLSEEPEARHATYTRWGELEEMRQMVAPDTPARLKPHARNGLREQIRLMEKMKDE